ncbi:VOC family protein [Rhodococcus sp. WS1]|nr:MULTISPECIES: VOC family protein [unclassified Rhodococcus (in: high G+C Gram-positive bacteria)]ROZ58976.1 VOC family protein [Rhodococcus sp. WS1]TQC36233.1 VOC family protein [Rhodococcus sp. WS7]
MAIEIIGPTARTALKFGDQKINPRPLGSAEQDPAWTTGAVETAGSEDLCFITLASPGTVREHLENCRVEVLDGPVTKLGALGEMVSHYCRDPDGSLIEITVYP